jgi:hypothetical protein
MYLQKEISKTLRNLGILPTTDLDLSRIWIRIRIRKSGVRIRGSGSVPYQNVTDR